MSTFKLETDHKIFIYFLIMTGKAVLKVKAQSATINVFELDIYGLVS